MSATTLQPPTSPSTTGSLRDIPPYGRTRRRRSRAMRALLLVAMGIAVVPLVLILVLVTSRALDAFGWTFLTEVEPPWRREGGGYLNGIVGTLYMVAVATVLAVPMGILAAVWLVEYGKGWLARVIRFFTDVMTGVPSIFVGLFIYALLVQGGLGFGTFVGGVALAVIMLPIVVRSSEEMLRLVPEDQRAAAAGLGARKWQTIMKIVLPSAAPGLATGAMLAVARAAGETAPLLLTAFGSLHLVTAFQGTSQASIPQMIYRGARQPFPAGQQRAWAGALVLLALVLILTLTARWISRRALRNR